MDEEDDPRGGGRALLGAFNVFLVVSAFVFGFLSGIISDGTVEVLNDFKRAQPTRSMAPSGQDAPAPATRTAATVAEGASASQAVATPVPVKPSGTIEWAIAVPPGTPLTDVVVRSAQKTDPIRLRLATLEKGRPATAAATIWLDPGATATISLPSGWYRAGSTRLRPGIVWDERAGDETYLDRAIRIDPVDPSEKGPSLTISDDGTMSVKDARTSKATPGSRPKRKRQVRDEEYFGLGRGEDGTGTSTYG